MTTASSRGLLSAPVPVRRATCAELVRWRRSSVAFAPLLGFAVATLQALMFVAVGIAHGWASVLAWNVIWVTGLALPATGLIVGLVAERDRGARDGGTTWRNVTPLTSSVARLAVVAGAVVLMNVLAVIPVLAVGSVVANGPAPVGRTVLTALAVSLGCVAIIPILDLVARRRGLFITLGLAVVWSVAGALPPKANCGGRSRSPGRCALFFLFWAHTPTGFPSHRALQSRRSLRCQRLVSAWRCSS